jgi:hypothetical protein
MPSGGRLLNVGRFDSLGAGLGVRPTFRPAARVSRGGFGSTARNYTSFGG